MLVFLNISTSEVAIVLLVVLLLFGPQKLPEIVRFIGKLINQVKYASEEVKREITKASEGIDKEVRDAASNLRKEADQVRKQVMEAVPRQSIRTFEKATPADYKKDTTDGDEADKVPGETGKKEAEEG